MAPIPAWQLEVHEEVASTSSTLIERAREGAADGTAILARRQTAARGQGSRVWQAIPGNLFLSVLLRPMEAARDIPQWALLSAVAVAEACTRILPPQAPLRLKWPNDLMLDGAKCGGILVESALRPDGMLDWLVVGVGINLAHAPVLPDRRTACLVQPGKAPMPPEDFAPLLLDRLWAWRQRRLVEGFGPVRAEWQACGPEIGAELSVRSGPHMRQGRYAGLAENGSLRLRSGDAEMVLPAGEVQ